LCEAYLFKSDVCISGQLCFARRDTAWSLQSGYLTYKVTLNSTPCLFALTVA
jgi:hypothetical protein